MRKPVFAICEQKRHRPACTAAQSDQCLYSLPRLYNSSSSISEISSLYLVSVAAQASLSLPWSRTLKIGFLVTWLICIHVEKMQREW